MEFSEISKMVHKNSQDHGWWDNLRPVPELLCLIHSEVSEALEGYRRQDWDNIREELADIIIRVMDMAEGFEIDLEREVIKKHQTNVKRPFRHGGKAC